VTPQRESHPPLRWFADRADGRLSVAREAKLAAHLAAGCVSCAVRAVALSRTIAALGAGPLDPPPRALRRAAARIPAKAIVAAGVTSVRRVLAQLVDGRELAPALALRAAPGDERRLLWTVGPWEMDACVVLTPRGADLLGQVVPADDAELAVEGEVILRSEKRRFAARLARDGRFSLRGVPAGTWTFEGRFGTTAFATPSFVIERAG
jgi:hypothetical protein